MPTMLVARRRRLNADTDSRGLHKSKTLNMDGQDGWDKITKTGHIRYKLIALAVEDLGANTAQDSTEVVS